MTEKDLRDKLKEKPNPVVERFKKKCSKCGKDMVIYSIQKHRDIPKECWDCLEETPFCLSDKVRKINRLVLENKKCWVDYFEELRNIHKQFIKEVLDDIEQIDNNCILTIKGVKRLITLTIKQKAGDKLI